MVYPDLVVYDKNGEPETVQCQKLTPLMLNELQRRVAELEELLKRVEELEAAARRHRFESAPIVR